jgi:hypothetical protein
MNKDAGSSEPRVPWQERLKRDITFFQAHTGMKFTTIGNKAIKNARLWERLEAGGTVTVEIADEIYEWMAIQGFHFNS